MSTSDNDDNRIDPERHYDLRETARLVFRRQRRWLYRHLPALTKKAGFPKPISPVGQRFYSGEALLNWVHRNQAQDFKAPQGKATGRLAERIKKAEEDE